MCITDEEEAMKYDDTKTQNDWDPDMCKWSSNFLSTCRSGRECGRNRKRRDKSLYCSFVAVCVILLIICVAISVIANKKKKMK